MHEITGRDCVLLVEGHPLSGMGNWHGRGETQQWDSETQEGLADEDVRRVLGVGDWEITTVPLADLRRQPALYEVNWNKGSVEVAMDLLRREGYIVLEGNAKIDGHVGIACGNNPPHYFPTTQYGVLQNESLIDLSGVFIEAAQKERGIDLPILSAGTLRDRRMAFVSVGVPDDAALDGLPARSHALNLGTSHDGTCALVGTLASYIVVCANTFRASLLGSAPLEVRVKHTNAIEDLEQARQILRDMIDAQTATDVAITRLLDTEYPANKFQEDLTSTVLPVVYQVPDEDAVKNRTRHDNRVEDIVGHYYGTNVPAAHRGTAWGALMAVQGWEQHDKATRTPEGQRPRHRAALAIQRTVASATSAGYPLAAALMGTPLPGLEETLGTDEAGTVRTLAEAVQA